MCIYYVRVFSSITFPLHHLLLPPSRAGARARSLHCLTTSLHFFRNIFISFPLLILILRFIDFLDLNISYGIWFLLDNRLWPFRFTHFFQRSIFFQKWLGKFFLQNQILVSNFLLLNGTLVFLRAAAFISWVSSLKNCAVFSLI